MTGIYIDEGFGVCTDGYRMHYGYIGENLLPSGLYYVKSVTKKMIVLESDTFGNTYPDYKRVFPTIEGMSRPKYFNGDKGLFVKEIMKSYTSDNSSYPLDQLLDAYMEDSNVSFIQRNDKAPLCIYDEDHCRSAIVMPTKCH